MYLLINTSAYNCEFILMDGDKKTTYEWEAGRTLARDILTYIENILQSSSKSFHDLTGIGVFEGPGSFTGLRIGIVVMNTLADSLNIPIVSARGDDWIVEVVDKLKSNIDQKIVLPFYGSEANITVSNK